MGATSGPGQGDDLVLDSLIDGVYRPLSGRVIVISDDLDTAPVHAPGGIQLFLGKLCGSDPPFSAWCRHSRLLGDQADPNRFFRLGLTVRGKKGKEKKDSRQNRYRGNPRHSAPPIFLKCPKSG